jgi:hypothetical protein
MACNQTGGRAKFQSIKYFNSNKYKQQKKQKQNENENKNENENENENKNKNTKNKQINKILMKTDFLIKSKSGF